MAIAFLFLSILGVDVFRRAGDIPVMIIFVGLTLIYATEIPTRFFSWNLGVRITGLFQVITAVWLMYCTYAITVDLALGAKAWI
jgi:predicted outer membrane lipoprotein